MVPPRTTGLRGYRLNGSRGYRYHWQPGMTIERSDLLTNRLTNPQTATYTSDWETAKSDTKRRDESEWNNFKTYYISAEQLQNLMQHWLIQRQELINTTRLTKSQKLLHLWLKNCKICCTSGYNKSKTWSIQKLTEPISNLINRCKSTEQLQNLTENWLPQKQTNSSDWYDQLCNPSIRTEIQTIKRDYHVDCQISRLIQSGIKSN